MPYALADFRLALQYYLHGFAMSNIIFRTLGALGLAGAASAASAGFLHTDIYIQQNFYQSGPSASMGLMDSPLANLYGPGANAKIQFEVTLNAKTDFSAITVSGPGMASPRPVTLSEDIGHGNWLAYYGDDGFTSMAALNAKYALGSTYTFTGSGRNPADFSGTSSISINYGANHDPLAAPGGAPITPLLTAASYSGLQGMDPTAASSVAFNAPFYGNSSKRLVFLVFDAAGSSTPAFDFATPVFGYESSPNRQNLASLSAPVINIAAGTLKESTSYIYALGYESNFTISSKADLAFANYTFGQFTTASIPEPSMNILLGLSFASLALISRRKRAAAKKPQALGAVISAH